MRFLADENFPGSAVSALRQASHEVDWIRQIEPGARDEHVLKRAVETGAILLTFDKDFGELAWRMNRAAGFGVILFRVPMTRAAEAGVALARVVQSRTDWTGHFSVVEPSRLRMRPFVAD